MTVPPFEVVVAEHGPTVMRVCRALLRQADAEDAWAETFLAAMRAYPTLRPDSNVRGWLVTIAHRKALDQIRSAGRAANPSGDIDRLADRAPAHGDDPFAGVDTELWDAMRSLTPNQQAAVLHHHVGGMPFAEIGEALGISAAAARRSSADGIANLRRRYSPPSAPTHQEVTR